MRRYKARGPRSLLLDLPDFRERPVPADFGVSGQFITLGLLP